MDPWSVQGGELTTIIQLNRQLATKNPPISWSLWHITAFYIFLLQGSHVHCPRNCLIRHSRAPTTIFSLLSLIVIVFSILSLRPLLPLSTLSVFNAFGLYKI